MCRVKAIASSVERLLRYVNCSGSSEGRPAQSRCVLWRASQNACWRWVSEQWASSHSRRDFIFLWYCTMVDFLKHAGTQQREVIFKMSVKTQASWKAHALSTRPGMLSGPTAFRMFTVWGSGYSATKREWTHLFCSSRGSLSVWAVFEPRNERKNY